MQPLSCPLGHAPASTSRAITRLLLRECNFLAGAPTHQQILVGLSVLGTHDHVNYWIYARCQVDKYVASYVQPVNVNGVFEGLADGDGKVADDERSKYYENHLEEFLVFGCHLTRSCKSG